MINQKITGSFQVETIRPSFDSSSLLEQIVNILKSCDVDMVQEAMGANILGGLEVVECDFSNL